MQGIFTGRINNSVFAAYNNVVEKITVTQSGAQSPYMSYLYGKVTDKFSFLPTDSGLETDGDRTTLVFCSERKYCPYIRNYTEENIADVIAVGYKYQYFSKNLFLPLLSAAEKDILQADYDLQADVLKVGHHGSSTSSSQAFLQAVKPKYAVISVGVGNSYHHPEEEALQRLQSIGAEIYRTDLQGTATASAAQRFMQMRQETTPLRRRLFISRTRNRRNFIWKAVPPCRMRKTVFILRIERKPFPLAIRPAAPASHKQAGASHRRREKGAEEDAYYRRSI